VWGAVKAGRLFRRAETGVRSDFVDGPEEYPARSHPALHVTESQIERGKPERQPPMSTRVVLKDLQETGENQ